MPGNSPIRGTEGPVRTWGLKDIEKLLDVLAGREITEFELEQHGVKIRVKRGDAHAGNPGVAEAYFSAPPSPTLAPAGPPASVVATPAPPVAPAVAEPTAESTEGFYVQKSPIVGTFYAAPAPNAPPFVKLGDVVQVGQVLCIIEAMKLMNELEAEVAGEIVRVYVENAQPVEYGQSLFAIKPSHKK
jgi:acetyl-CoA carboxylase biotin carboxyl carrier protein